MHSDLEEKNENELRVGCILRMDNLFEESNVI